MALVSELEDTFGVQFTTDEVIEFSSFEKGIQLLASKGLVI
jgi:acyl carrier protein